MKKLLFIRIKTIVSLVGMFSCYCSILNAQELYPSVKLGSQEWMISNLSIVTFRNGDTIPLAKTAEEWEKAGENGQPAWCYYDNNTLNGEKFGKLYNWYAVNDSRGLAPIGWHIANDKEWKQLSDYIGGEKLAGKKLKSSAGWNTYKGKGTCKNCEKWGAEYKAGNSCNVCKDKRQTSGIFPGDGTDEFGFRSLAAGYRFGDGYFSKIGEFAGWWTATDAATHYTWSRTLVSKSAQLYRTFYDKEDGLSVRCIKD
ncbi:MAG: fibrobacter succinogenes major paralogous domain-containing protein [Bacteroidota bacterium]